MSKFISVLEALRPISPAALSVNFLLTLASFWLLFLKQKDLPPTIPLWFSKEWGEARLTEPVWLWLIPSSSLFVFFLNNLLASFLRSFPTLATTLVWFGAFFSFISLYTLYRLIILAG
jgi:hypothetical protein